MASVSLEVVQETPKDYHCVRIMQGMVAVGTEPLSTYLKSCVCVGFHHRGKGVGAMSHVTGFHTTEGHSAEGALRLIARKLKHHGLKLENCECFLIGGVDRARNVYESVLEALERRGLTGKELDVLGNYHRKIVFIPQTGQVLLYKKGDRDRETYRGTFASDNSMQCFHDPRKRIITGASLFFRNTHLLRNISEVVLPELLRRGKRLHVWCAGCSNGMEAYSIAMVIMEYLEKKQVSRVDFKVLGTDISTDALAMAKKGVYRGIQRTAMAHEKVFRRYTSSQGSQTVEIDPALKALVSFRQRDIREGSRNHRFEFVVCDHVLQYFDPILQVEFLKGLLTGLASEGFLYVSSPSPVVARRLEEMGDYRMMARHFYQKKN